MQIDNLDDIIAIPNLYRWILTRFKPGRVNILFPPTDINNKAAYLRGLKLYLDAIKSDNIKLDDLTREDIFYAAYIGLQWHNLQPLKNIAEVLKLKDSTYHLLHLVDFK